MLGADPRAASAAEGEEVLGRAISAWSAWIDEALHQEPGALLDLYKQRLASYDAYITQFGGDDWNGALDRWWVARLEREAP